MTNIYRNPLVAVGLSGLMAAGIIGAAGVAFAQEGSETPSATGEEANGDSHGAACNHAGHRHHGLGIRAIIEASDLENSVFIDGFADGLTVAEVLEQNGLDPDTIAGAALGDLEARLSEKVAAGDMTQEDADTALANAEARIGELMDSAPTEDWGRGIKFAFGALSTVAEFLGIDESVVAEALRNGETLADLAAANGSSADALIDHLVAEANAKIDEKVAAGELEADRAETLKANLEERITTFVNEGGRFGGRPFGGHHRFQPFGEDGSHEANGDEAGTRFGGFGPRLAQPTW